MEMESRFKFSEFSKAAQEMSSKAFAQKTYLHFEFLDDSLILP